MHSDTLSTHKTKVNCILHDILRITVTETVTDKTPALDLSKTKSDEITAANVYTPINHQLLTKTTEDEYVQIEKSINM